MLNKLGKKICAGVGAFITVFGSNALSNAMQTKEKAIQNAAETAGNVNRNSGGYSRNGAILSPRTFFELLMAAGVLGYEYKTRKGLPKGVDNNGINFQNQIDQLTKEKNQLGIEIDELKAQISELQNNAKDNIDAKKLEIFFEFLRNYISPISFLNNRVNEYWLNSWYKLEEEKYEFVPYFVGGSYYSIVGNLNLKGLFGQYNEKFKLSEKYHTEKETWDLNLSPEDIECISRGEIPLGALERASIQKGYHNKVLSSDFGLWEYNGGDVKWEENCKRVFSKVQKFNYDKGWVLCEGFITRSGNNREGLVVRLTYGDLVKKVENK